MGQGNGRFVVILSKVRLGFPIDIFTDEADTQVHITWVSDGKAIVKMAGPKAGHLLVYTIPKDLALCSYRIMFFGHDGRSGAGVGSSGGGNVIQVDAN